MKIANPSPALPRPWGLFVLLFCVSAGFAATTNLVNVPRPDFWVPDGPINAMAEQDGILYLGGDFTTLRPNRGPGIGLNLSSLDTYFDFPQVNGPVLAVAADQGGGFYIGGEFTRVDGLARTNLAYIGADRRVAAWSPAANGRVLALAWASGVLYVGGEFTSIAGQPRNRLAA